MPTPNLHLPAALTAVLPCSLSLCASFLDAGRTSHRKQFFIIQALPCPFHSEGFQPTALDGGSQPFALAGPISTFGLDWGYQCPTPNRYPCFFLPKAFCIPLPRQHLPAHNRSKFPTHRTEPPSHAAHKLHAFAQVSPCQVFFLAHPTASHSIGRLALL